MGGITQGEPKQEMPNGGTASIDKMVTEREGYGTLPPQMAVRH
jgi:hypothetical protein